MRRKNHYVPLPRGHPPPARGDPPHKRTAPPTGKVGEPLPKRQSSAPSYTRTQDETQLPAGGRLYKFGNPRFADYFRAGARMLAHLEAAVTTRHKTSSFGFVRRRRGRS